jgi:MFS family permease
VAMSYGTITDHSVSPDSRNASRARRPSGVPTEKLTVVTSQDAVASSSRTDDTDPDDDDVSQYSAQAGVKRLEAIASTWSRWGLFAAYFGICLLAYATSLEGQTTVNLTIYATSAFKAHSLVATVLVIQNIVLSVVKPPMTKIADVFGRFEAFTLSVLIYSIGYVQQAASDNVKTYAAAQIFYSAGATGLQILIQIFIADTSDLTNRALCSNLPQLPFLINVWIGAPLAGKLLTKLSWRWGYGIWAIVLPIAYLPLALSLYTNQRKAAKLGRLPPSPFRGLSWWAVVKLLWVEMDVFGLLLLCAAFSLLLIPLTLAAKNGWDDPSLVAMLLVGAVCLAVFPFWEKNMKLAPRAFFPFSLFRNTNVLAAVGISFFYFSKLSFSSAFRRSKLIKSSGVLSLDIPLLPVIPPGGPRQIRRRCGSNRANVDVRGYHHRLPGLPVDQVHEPLQVLRHPWCLHLLPGSPLDGHLPR